METESVKPIDPSHPIILIVDDHAFMRHAICEWLSYSLPHCTLIQAQSGEAGVTLAVTNAPQVVLMDIALPGMSGIEATRAIKAQRPSTHIVILSILDDDLHQADALVAGASAFVSKRTMHQDLVPVLKGLVSGVVTALL